MNKQPSSEENLEANLLTLPAGETAMPEGCFIPADDTSFRDLKLLGMGGMGIVYEADDQALERKVALKMLRSPYRNDPALVNKFIKEARVTAKIDHPNIIAVHHLGHNKDCGAYFSMRRIRGETLQAVLRRLRDGDAETRRHYTLRRLLNIFIAACNGVAAAHQHGILHCDLKPSNIMIGDRGEVWVLDWGVAREIDSGDEACCGLVEGTPAFMAPELLAGKKCAPDQKSEVYALGTILFCILTWQDAPVDLSLPHGELLKHVVSGKTIPLRPAAGSGKLPVELTAICRRAMAGDPEKRYADVAGLLTDLHNYQDGFPVSAYSHYPFYRFWKFLRRRPLIPIALVAALLTFGFYYLAEVLIAETRDKSMLRQAEYNAELADGLIRQTRRQYNHLTSPSSGTATLDMVRSGHKVQTGINLTMLEVFASFDALNGASDAAVESFMRYRGAVLCKHLLRLQIYSGNQDAPAQALGKIRRRWGKLLEYGCKHDKELAAIVRMIDSNHGMLHVNVKSPEFWTGCSLIAPDGKSKSVDFSGSGEFELEPGDNRIYFTTADGRVTAAFFRSMPGHVLRLELPGEEIPPGFALIPADHWFVEVKDDEPVLKLLPAYLISSGGIADAEYLRIMADMPDELLRRMRSFVGRAIVPAGDAAVFCRELGKHLKRNVRLPDELELRKSLTPAEHGGDRTGFYGVSMPFNNTPVFICGSDDTVMVYDPASDKVLPVQADTVAAIRVVIE